MRSGEAVVDVHCQHTPFPFSPGTLAGGADRRETAADAGRAGAACMVPAASELIKLFGLTFHPLFQPAQAPCGRSSVTGFIHFSFWLKAPQQAASAQGETMHKTEPGVCFPCSTLCLKNLAGCAQCIISWSP